MRSTQRVSEINVAGLNDKEELAAAFLPALLEHFPGSDQFPFRFISTQMQPDGTAAVPLALVEFFRSLPLQWRTMLRDKPLLPMVLAAIVGRRFEVIPEPETGFIYMVRIWLSWPERNDRSGRLESGDSLLLHWLVRGDGVRDLHDHPWGFRSLMIGGFYVERSLLNEWHQDGRLCEMKVEPFNTVERHASDRHAIVRVSQGGAFTLVRTGPRTGEWGFYRQDENGSWHYTAYPDALQQRLQVRCPTNDAAAPAVAEPDGPASIRTYAYDDRINTYPSSGRLSP